jgi:hypothetical protein
MSRFFQPGSLLESITPRGSFSCWLSISWVSAYCLTMSEVLLRTDSFNVLQTFSHSAVAQKRLTYFGAAWRFGMPVSLMFRLWVKCFVYEWNVSSMSEMFHLWVKCFVYEWHLGETTYLLSLNIRSGMSLPMYFESPGRYFFERRVLTLGEDWGLLG